ncbi:MAG: hypothetical protein P1U53_04080 [Sulfitobacter sp.]|nr:hypothetical protein [Sulfitobacter sp.]
MSNILAFRPAGPTPRPAAEVLADSFASARRNARDVFWLKENAELLNILCVSGVQTPEAALAPYAAFYEGLEERLQLYPQYYRFLISICLDLEDLGFGADLGTTLCRWVARMGLADAELSDLQRAEARRLLARRDAAPGPQEGELAERLRAFISRPETFAMPNKKAAYELTHIVYYLAEYGARDPGLEAAALDSLEYAGLLAYLDQNMDLLAEVVTALRFAGRTPSPIWVEEVAAAHDLMSVGSDPAAPLMDGYHLYLVSGWAKAVAGKIAFAPIAAEGSLRFRPSTPAVSALRPLSMCLSDMGSARSADWSRMRGHVLSYLGPDGHQVLYRAELSSDRFEAFFEGFARAAG